MYKNEKITFAIIFITCFITSTFGLSTLPKHKLLDPCAESRVVRTMMAKDYNGIWARGGFTDAWDSSKNGCYRTKKAYQKLQKQGKQGL